MSAALPPLDEIRDAFQLFDDWEDRYRYIIDLGRKLPPFPEELRVDANKVRGCASQVWLHAKLTPSKQGAVLAYDADSDAHIVRGLIAILLVLYSGQPAKKILETDAHAQLREFALEEHLTSQRVNGLAAMIARIQQDAEKTLSN